MDGMMGVIDFKWGCLGGVLDKLSLFGWVRWMDKKVSVHFVKLNMKKNNKIYSLGKGYSPFIYKNETGLVYSFPVTSGHDDLTFEFTISTQDLDVLKSHEFRFKILYFVVFHEAQSTFGTGHTKPRKYTSEEFENTKNKVLYKSELELKSYIKKFSKDKNLGEKYFDTFIKIVFTQN